MRSTAMVIAPTIETVTSAARLRHLRPPRPIVFPSEAKVPEKRRHFLLRMHLFSAIHRAFKQEATVGSDQFVYWNARDPKRCLAPDVFVRTGQPDADIDSWKSWERGGPPQLAIEIVSDSDSSEMRWEEKLERYHELGVHELVWFDADEPAGARVRVWDRIDEDLVERAVESDTTECLTLGSEWRVGPVGAHPVGLRLWHAGELLLDADEAAAAQQRRLGEAERRIAELEAELAKRR